MAPKKAYAPLTEEDRRRIGEARDVLKEYGLYVDVADMSDVAYERRNVRMKALDIAVQAVGPKISPSLISDVLTRAKEVEAYIWEGETDGDV